MSNDLSNMSPQHLAGFWDDFKSAIGGGGEQPSYLSKPTLSRGDEGAEVTELQGLLGINATGSFNAATENKVKQFQASRGLSPTGSAGPEEWAALLGEIYTPGAKGAKAAETVKDIASFGAGIASMLQKPQDVPVTVTSPLVEEPTSWTPYIIGGVTVTALVGGLAYYFLVHKKKNEAFANPWEEDEMDWEFDDGDGEVEDEEEADIVEDGSMEAIGFDGLDALNNHGNSALIPLKKRVR